MADYKQLIPFILKWEGGYVNDPSDLGGETNKGITYSTWCQFFGTDKHDNFVAMSDDDWGHIFKTGFWDKCMADDITDQNVANIFVDWFWASGYYAIRHLQQLANVPVDGAMGPHTLAAINAVDGQTMFNNIKQARVDFVHAIVQGNPVQARFEQGWLNRINAFTYA